MKTVVTFFCIFLAFFNFSLLAQSGGNACGSIEKITNAIPMGGERLKHFRKGMLKIVLKDTESSDQSFVFEESLKPYILPFFLNGGEVCLEYKFVKYNDHFFANRTAIGRHRIYSVFGVKKK